MARPTHEPADPLVAPVDPLIAGIHDRWADQGLSGGPWSFMAICAISRLHQILGKALDVELKRLQLNRTGYFLLTTLALITGGRARLSTLGRIVMVHPTTVKLTVDQLEEAGLVTRAPHPHDRRAILVQITELGRQRARAANDVIEHAVDGPLAVLAEMHQELFLALQPARLAVEDDEF